MVRNLLIAIAALTMTAWAQEAGLVGNVTDSTGGLIAGATATARNPETGVERSATTDERGRFSISPLAIGKYTLTVEKTGFQASVVSGIYLTIGQVGHVDAVLQVGHVAEKVTVIAETALLQAEQATIGQSVENKSIVDLPLNGRDFAQLVALTPGAQTAGQSSRTFASQVLVNGARNTKTTSTLDGVLNIDQLFGGFPTSPSLDAIEEFRVQSGNFSADQGMGPSNVSVTMKSGTNSFHGAAFEFLRNDKLDSRNFFQSHRGILKRNQFGGDVGGPIKRNKIFFFFGYEGERQRDGVDVNITVPSAAQRQGDFSGLRTIRDPRTGNPFPANMIPQNRIDQTAVYFRQYYPLPNSGTQFIASPSESLRRDQYNARYDHYIDDKNRMFARYTLYPYDFFTPEPIPSQGGDIRKGKSQSVAVNWNRILKPNIMNTLTLGWSRLRVTRVPSFLGTNHTVASGLQGFDETSAQYPGFPNLSIGGYQAINGLDWWPAVQPTDNWQIKEDFSVVHGGHNLRAGADLRRYFWSSRGAASGRGDLTYSGDYTGDGWADFLLGTPVYAFRQYPQENYNQKSYNLAWYFQDDWRITPSLTLNLGLRYEYDTWPVDSRNQFSSFAPSVGKFVVAHNPGQPPDLAAQPLAALATQLFGNLLVNAGDVGLPTRSLRFPDKNNWGPRFGLAYRPAYLKNTVVRLGYGIFYSLLDANNYSDISATSLPWIISQGVNNTLPVPTLDNHNLFAPFTAPGAAQPSLQPIVFDPHERIPYIQEWHVAVQHQLSNSTSVEVAYVANKGTRLETRLPFNRPLVPMAGAIAPRRPFPQLTEGYSVEGTALSNYNSLQVKLERRFSAGLSIVASYTRAKSMDNASSDFGSGVQDITRLYLEHAVSDFDVPQRLSVGYVYDLPFGAGRKFLASAKAPVQQILGGWELGGIVTLQSGTPFTVTSGRDIANIGTTSSQRPNRVASGNLDSRTVSHWFDTAAFVLNAPYTFGNSGRNILRGDGMEQWDLSAMKYFPIHESIRLQFRAEFFNILNHADFANPKSTLTASTFGRVTATSVNPRIGQVALKLIF